MIKYILTLLSITVLTICIARWNNGSFEILYDSSSSNIENQQIFDISNTLYSNAIKQIKIWRQLNSDIDKNTGILNVLEQLEYYLKSNIILFLDAANNKSDVLDSYLLEIQKTFDLADYFQWNLEFETKNNNNEMVMCMKWKTYSDRDYFNALNLKDSQSMWLAIEQSKKYDECISRNRIEINSKRALLTRLISLRNALKDKYNFLSKNKKLIIENFWIIKNNLASELINITEQLNEKESE